MPPRTDHERNAAIWAAYVGGRAQVSIAVEYGISQARVSQIITAWRATLPQESKADVAMRELAFLDDLRARAMELIRMEGAPVTAGKDGDIVRDPEHKDPETQEGRIVRDYSGRMAAMNIAAQTSRDLRKLLGLDAPTRTEITGGVKHEIVGVDPEDLT